MIVDIFQDIIDETLGHISDAVDEELSTEAVNGLKTFFRDAIYAIAGKTLDGLYVDIIARKVPFVLFDKNLCTKEQIEEASEVLSQELAEGKTVIPETLMEVVDERRLLLERAILDMFSDLKMHKRAVCDTLYGGRQYNRFLSIRAGAGDCHNGGRSVTILETELGRMVYKPRSLMTDVRLRDFAEKYFPGCVYIPRCFTDGASFGVCEYVEKRVASTRDEAEAWYRALGGLSVMIKLLGSTDMHHENIMAVDGLPAILDPETVLFPHVKGFQKGEGRFMEHLRSSLYFSALMPARNDERQFSILADTESEYSSAPVVDGEAVGWEDCRDSYFDVFRKTYRSCLERKEELSKDIPAFFSDIPVRVMLVDTQYYADLMIRTWTRKALADKESRDGIKKRLKNVLSEARPEDETGTIIAETTAILRGDIPCFFTYGESHDLYADANIVYPGGIRKSGVEHALDRLAGMNEKELSFEEDIVRTSLALRIMKKDQGEPEAPERGAEPLPVDIALKEAEELFQKVYDVRLNAPDGSLGWLSVGDDGKGVDLADEGAGTGITGIGLFAAALLSVSSDTSIIRKAGICLDRVHDELGSRFDELKGKPQTEASRIISSKLGEASGFGGILRALVFMNRYSENDAFAPLIHDILKFLSERLDCKQVTMTDRLGGLSGLIATLCDCPEYSGDPLALDIIGECSERLMELKSFDADGKALWETISKRHQISGAGHGMIGIAYALYKAGKLLDENKWAAAVREAVDFELETYSEKLGTWPDRRNWPPEGYMHGYCSGAPGIGILCKGIDTEGTDRIAEYAERAVNSKPLLFRDHFCCGNSSVVEYYLTMGRRDDAGRVLAGMYKRKKQTGAYRLMSTGYNDIPLPTFLSGFSGIGYEMLRYAYTDRIYSVLG